MAKRVFLIVLDSVGVGEAPDAELFDDVGCDTFGTCVRSGNLKAPNLERLGMFCLEGTSFWKKCGERHHRRTLGDRRDDLRETSAHLSRRVSQRSH